MPVSAPTPTRTAQTASELDAFGRNGRHSGIVIPPCPVLLLRLQAAMAQDEPDLNDVAAIAASDVAMAATLLRNANGPLHAGGQPVQSVGQAMNRLGVDETAALLTAFLVRHAIPVDHPQLRRFWERSAMRGAAMRFIAERLPGLLPDMAQLYGLFLHVGQPVLLQCMRGYAGTLVEATARIDRSFIATENANHRTDHAVVGAMVARAWHLAPQVVAAVRLHHDLELVGGSGSGSNTEPELQTLLAAGLLADHLVRQRDGLAPERDWNDHGARALQWLAISEDDLVEWDEELQLRLDLQ